VAATNVYGRSAKTTPVSAWTLAVPPVKPSIAGTPAFTVSVGSGDGNPGQTVYALKCTTLGQWVQAQGSLGASPLFKTAADWGTVTVTGLAPGTAYSFSVCAQNGAGVATALGPEASATTAALVSVPNLSGLSLLAAEQALAAATLSLGAVATGYSDTQAFGNVFTQTPSAGTQVTVNTAVNVIISQGPAPVGVPAVIGLESAQAQAALVASGLTVGDLTESYSGTAAAGIVISQNPAAGTQLQRELPVSLVVSRGPAPVTVPDVAGLPADDAKALIRNAGLNTGAQTNQYSSTVAKLNVISQNPAPGTLALPGTAVLLTVSLGPDPNENEGEPDNFSIVPDLTLMTVAAAQNTLAGANLILGSTALAYSDTVPAQLVASQSPAAGMQLTAGSAVNLGISLGPEPAEGEGETPQQVTVPDVTSMPLARAQTVLLDADLTVGSQTQADSDTVPLGSIVYQSPTAGIQVTPGSAVNLVVSRGPASVEGEGEPANQVTVPNVTALSLPQALAVLTGADLAVGAQTQAYSNNMLAGSILAQDPAAGAEVDAGTAVDIVISLGPLPGEGEGEEEGEPAPKVLVPSVTAMPVSQAQTTLLAASLLMGARKQVYSSSVAAESVVSQSPAAGVQVDAGTAVDLAVSLGPEPAEGEGEDTVEVLVPNVVAMPVSQACAVVTAANLEADTAAQVYSATVAAGRIISQNPTAGARVATETVVYLAVSLGPDPMTQEGEGELETEGEVVVPVSVPHLANLTLPAAKAALVAANLVPGTVTDECSETIPVETVIRTFPDANALVPPKTVINLTVSIGPEEPGGCLSGCTGGTSAQKARRALGDLLLAGLSLAALQVAARQPGGRN